MTTTALALTSLEVAPIPGPKCNLSHCRDELIVNVTEHPGPLGPVFDAVSQEYEFAGFTFEWIRDDDKATEWLVLHQVTRKAEPPAL